MSLLKVLCLSFILVAVDSARILGIYPTPSISHQVVFRALTLELVKRGHEVVVVTTDPAFKNKESPRNLTEIDTSEEYNTMIEMYSDPEIIKHLKRGVILDGDAMTATTLMFKIHLNVFNHPEVVRLINDKHQKFDLIIFEGLSYGALMLSEIFKAPAILFTSLYGIPLNYESVGAVARHPILHPYLFRKKFINLSLLDKFEQLYEEYKMWKFDQANNKLVNEFLKSRFGPDTPTVDELQKHVVLLLANSHPIFDGNRPVPPATVYLGALHMKPVKPLPEDLKLYLDSSTRGVVYVSLGTNVRPSTMDKDFLDAFLSAFEKIPYDILWKFDGDSLDNLPNNVKIQKWFPQRDLLGHPNIKLFVMQGGLQSTDESIDAEVPLVGIPMLADQWFNTNKYVELGVGVQIDSITFVADDLVKAVDTVANDPSYKENMKKLKAIMQDQPETPLERAVWWTEHVLRHKGSRHLIGPAATISWAEYLMLDVLITIAIGLTILGSVTVAAIFYIVKLVITINNQVKVKQH